MAKIMEGAITKSIANDESHLIISAERSIFEISSETAALKVALKLAKCHTRKEFLDMLVEMVCSWSGCHCVGIRMLDDLGNMPYESYTGFSREFWEWENWLSVKNDVCICTRIITEQTEPQDSPITTPDGSFRCDNMHSFLSGLPNDKRERFRGICPKYGYLSLAFVPIRYRGKVIGAIHIADDETGKVPPRLVEFLESITPLIGELVQKFNLKDELNTRLRQQAMIARLGRRALKGKDLSTLIDDVAVIIAGNRNVKYSAVWEFLPDMENMVMRAGVGWREGFAGQVLNAAPLFEEGSLSLSNNTLIVNNLHEESGLIGQRLHFDHDIVSLISVVIPGKERPFGILGAYSDSMRSFTKYDVNFLHTIANILGEAIERKKSEEETRLLYKISLAISGAGAPQDSMAIALKHICTFTGWGYGEVWASNAESTFLERRAFWDAGNVNSVNFSELSNNSKFEKGVGLFGELRTSKKPVWIPDITSDINCRRLMQAKEAGFKAAVACPIIEGGEVVSVIVFYMLEACEKNERLMDILSVVGAQIGALIKRSQAEDVIIKSEERFRNMVETTSEWIWETDENYRYTYVSPKIKELLGYEPEEIIGKTHYDLMREDDVERLSAVFAPIAAERRPFCSIETMNIHKNGNTVVIETSGVPVTDISGFKGYRGVDRDVTRHKELEARLLHSQKMEAMGQLAGGVAHDFNNALTAILGFASLLIIKKGDDELVRSFAENILGAGSSAASLVRSLLAFSRKESSNPYPIDIREVIENLTLILSKLTGEDIAIRVVLSDDALTVMMDRAQIEQVLMNLATNARDAMSDRGIITISAKPAKTDEEFVALHGHKKAGLYAMISFADTGQGMDEETKRKIFDPFFTTKEVGKGTGLGLSMIYGTVKQHDGYITVNSEPGKGTDFKIYLPLADETAIPEKEAKEKFVTMPPGNETILLAEDDERVRLLVLSVLTDYGYNVIVAVNGEDAINKFKENKDRVHLCISDVIMPRMGGMEAYEEIRKIRPDIKFVFMSGHATNKIGIIFENELDFIAKPASPTDFLTKVREVLDR